MSLYDKLLQEWREKGEELQIVMEKQSGKLPIEKGEYCTLHARQEQLMDELDELIDWIKMARGETGITSDTNCEISDLSSGGPAKESFVKKLTKWVK